ncbi:hypothetical protein F1B01_00900 [Shigella sonnei]|nr:hypothetical protein [Shigella sonnei]
MFKVNTFYKMNFKNGDITPRLKNMFSYDLIEPFEVLEVTDAGSVCEIRTSEGKIYQAGVGKFSNCFTLIFSTDLDEHFIECPNPKVYEVPHQEIKKNGPHEYTKVETPHGVMWRHNSPFGSKGTFAQLAKPYDDEKYVVVLLSEQGTQDRGCQRSGLLSELEAHNQAREFVEKNPGSEALVMKAITQYITAQPVVHPVEINFVK